MQVDSNSVVMRLFTLIKILLRNIHTSGAPVDLKTIQKRERLFLLRYVPERGMEQDILAHELAPLLSSGSMSETFYGYILWVAGELTNNIFDHAQTLGHALKGCILALLIN